MTANETIIHKFYAAFANADVEQMCEYYHPNVQFRDPAFGSLQGEEVLQMWRMLVERSNGNLKIDLSEMMANEYLGTAKWIATYRFTATDREVVNTIESKFQFKEGLIIKHIDDFDIWKWTKQALGIKGLLLGWTGFMQKRVQDQARLSLHKYCEKKEIKSRI